MLGFFIILLVISLLGAVVAWWGLRRRRRLSAQAVGRVRAQWEHVLSLRDPARRVLEAEKVLDHALRELGYEGGFGEKLKKAGARLPNLQNVWEAHKLRNRIAHEPGAQVNEREGGRAVQAFEKAIHSLF
jgi:hypothetical protein